MDKQMKHLGWFSEITDKPYSKKAKEYIVENINYDREKVINYLHSFKREAVCPKYSYDCFTGKQLSTFFECYTDGEYIWCDYLAYHIERYNIGLPLEFIKKIGAEI